MPLGFVVANVVPVICDTCAAVSAVHTLKFAVLPDDPEFPAAEFAAAAALDAPAAAAALVPSAPACAAPPAAVFDPAEQAVADAATARVRLAAVKTAATRMSSPR